MKEYFILYFSILSFIITSPSKADDATKQYVIEYLHIGMDYCLDLVDSKKFNIDERNNKLVIDGKDAFDLKGCGEKLNEDCLKKEDKKACQKFTEMKNRLSAIKQVKGMLFNRYKKRVPRVEHKRRKAPLGHPRFDEMSFAQKKQSFANIHVVEMIFDKIKRYEQEFYSKGIDLTCETKNDCEALPLGNRLCGGPDAYIVLSKTSGDYQSKARSLEKLNEYIVKYQQQFMGNYAGLCGFEIKPKLTCLKNRCERIRK